MTEAIGIHDHPTKKLDEAFGHWLAGFVDGEGCFHITAQVNGPLGHRSYGCKFDVELRSDDAAILEEIHRRTSLGSIRSIAKASASRPTVRWEVKQKAECLALVDLFDQFPLRTKKANDFAIWRLAVAEWTRYGRGQRGQDYAEMAQLQAQLRNGRRYMEVAS